MYVTRLWCLNDDLVYMILKYMHLGKKIKRSQSTDKYFYVYLDSHLETFYPIFLMIF